MKATRCFYNSVTALRRVFINEALECASTSSRLQCLRQPQVSTIYSPTQPRCSFSTQPALLRQMGRGNKNAKEDSSKDEQDAFPRDFMIKSPYIHVRDERTQGISEPLRTIDVLRDIDNVKQSLVTVWEPPRPKSDEEEGQQASDDKKPKWPVCRIVDRQAEAAKEREKAKEKRKLKLASKELEINWVIAKNDLNMKIKQLHSFLNKGYTVQLTLHYKNKKKNRQSVSMDAAEELVQTMKEAALEIPGTVEAKKPEGEIGQQLLLTYKGPQPKANSSS